MKRFFGLFIIFLLALSPCASAANTIEIPGAHNYIFSNTDASASRGESFSKYNDSLSTDIDTSLSFNETMQYLSEGKKPKYMVIDGDINSIQSCRFTISEGYPTGYHDIHNNFKYDLHDEIYKPTILYDPKDYDQPTTFLTNSTADVSLDQEAIFSLMVRNSQYVTLNKMDVPQIDEDSSDWNITFDSDANIDDVYELLSKCYSIINHVKMQFDIQSVSYSRQSMESYVHNLIIGKARGSDTSKYGGCYWPKFIGVSNYELEVMNMKYQTIKHYLKPASFAIETALLHLGDIQLVMKSSIMTAGDIPLVGDYIKSGLEWASYGLDVLRQTILWQKNRLDAEYYKADQMTWDISAEKSYRSLVDDGVMNATTPTEDQLIEYNSEIDGYKASLSNLTTSEYDRIFNYGSLEELRDSYIKSCKVYDDIIDTYNGFGIECPQKYYDYRDKFHSYYDDINNVEDMNRNEQKVWLFYQSILENQYNILDTLKWRG